MITRYDYRIAAGHNVALAALVNVETLPGFAGAGVRIPPASQPVNPYPNRVVALSGREYGDGVITHVWEFSTLPIAALEYLITTYLSGGTLASAPVTIYTRRHDRGVYARYNAYLTYPVPGEDYRYTRRHVLDLRLRFNGLELL